MKVRRVDVRRPKAKTLPGTRIFFFFGLSLLLTGGISILFADLLWRQGWTHSSTILLALFVLLLFFNVVGAMHSIYGFFLRRRGDPQRITNLKEYASRDISGAATAILFPIYNEEAADVYARLRATYESLERTGQAAHFDFHILSDSTEPARWIDEESRWAELVKSLNAAGRIFYRRRLWNEEKKSGNIRDFLNALGNRYRYFVVFDADSFMSGHSIVSLVQLMEVNPDVGIIQTPPALINAESLFGRLHQFASRLYSPLFTTGLNYWMQSLGNYVGHNAIIRTAPFMRFCGLPKLPGRRPFGGQILSHDFVEAALMLKNNWQVWFAHDLEESFEEGPQGLIEYAQRDRRWCQGNLQHILVLFGRGLRGISRLHLIFGIFGYLGGPLWLLFMLTFNARLFLHEKTGLSDITVRPWTPFLNLSATQHALLIFGLSTLVLLIPKILSLLELARDPERRRAFGGMARASLSAFLELVFSTLQAPLLMLWHTEFVITILLGRSVSWGKQNRQADGSTWAFAFRQHWKHMLIGLIWGGLIWRVEPGLLGWFVPVLLGMLLAVPFTVFTSRRTTGEWARRSGLFLTPEETEPSSEITLLRKALGRAHHKEGQEEQPFPATLSDVILDPYLNGLHVALLHARQKDPVTQKALNELRKGLRSVSELARKALREGLDSLNEKEQLLVLSESASAEELHRDVWRSFRETLGKSWQSALRSGISA